MVVAEGTGNKHRSVQRIIDKHLESLESFGKVRFEITPSAKGQEQKVYLLNESQATFLITLLRNTDIVVKFKIELVKQFYAMCQLLLEMKSPQWQQLRQQSKTNRRMETDALKKLVEYAREQGSSHPDKYYISYTKLANKAAGITDRKAISGMQLNLLIVAENIISRHIEEYIHQGIPYKDIYVLCKQKMESFGQIALLNTSA